MYAVGLKTLIFVQDDLETNKSLWRRKNTDGEWIMGTITSIAENNYGTFKPYNSNSSLSVIPKMVQEYNLNENDEVKVTTKPSPDGTKTYINEISTQK